MVQGRMYITIGPSMFCCRGFMFISEQKATAVAETPQGTRLVLPRGLGLVSPRAGLVYRRAGSVVSSPVRLGLATAWPQGPSAC